MLNIDIRLMKVMRKELAIQCFEKKCLTRSDSMMKCWFAIKMTSSTTGLPNTEKRSLFHHVPDILISSERHRPDCFGSISSTDIGVWRY